MRVDAPRMRRGGRPNNRNGDPDDAIVVGPVVVGDDPQNAIVRGVILVGGLIDDTVCDGGACGPTIPHRRAGFRAANTGDWRPAQESQCQERRNEAEERSSEHESPLLALGPQDHRQNR
ncbi:MAG: hypothetical protein GEU95_10075 [Rhizobiales bacterium]|nr:hypothetical protein [Hyphomicrobiales bacterium]